MDNYYNLFRMAWRLWKDYWGQGYIHYLVLASLIVLIASSIRKKEARQLLFYNLIIIVLYFTPPMTELVCYLIGYGVYWRFLWLIPTTPIIAYVVAGLEMGIPRKWLRFLVTCVALFIIYLAGVTHFESGSFTESRNVYKLPDDVVRFCDVIKRDSHGSPVRVASDEHGISYIRVYDSSFQMPYGRRGESPINEAASALYAQMNAPAKDYLALASLAKEAGCNYLAVCKPTKEGEELLQQNGYTRLRQVSHYVLFRAQEDVYSAITETARIASGPDTGIFGSLWQFYQGVLPRPSLTISPLEIKRREIAPSPEVTQEPSQEEEKDGSASQDGQEEISPQKEDSEKSIAYLLPSGMETSGMETSGMEASGMEASGMEASGMEASSIEVSGMETSPALTGFEEAAGDPAALPVEAAAGNSENIPAVIPEMPSAPVEPPVENTASVGEAAPESAIDAAEAQEAAPSQEASQETPEGALAGQASGEAQGSEPVQGEASLAENASGEEILTGTVSSEEMLAGAVSGEETLTGTASGEEALAGTPSGDEALAEDGRETGESGSFRDAFADLFPDFSEPSASAPESDAAPDAAGSSSEEESMKGQADLAPVVVEGILGRPDLSARAVGAGAFSASPSSEENAGPTSGGEGAEENAAPASGSGEGAAEITAALSPAEPPMVPPAPEASPTVTPTVTPTPYPTGLEEKVARVRGFLNQYFKPAAKE